TPQKLKPILMNTSQKK
ncbi:cag pathogenicity island protein, partial [Helicobacter pylori]